MGEINDDRELTAIATVLAALKDLNEAERQNVLGYVFRRLNIFFGNEGSQQTAVVPAENILPSEKPRAAPLTGSGATDIRSFAADKKPRSAIEMAAVVGYYVENLAPEHERKSTVTQGDIEKYFKQANFPLAKATGMTLVHAKNAGYFDQKGRGEYKLNPVGHNLVAHRLPGGTIESSSSVRTKKSSPHRRLTFPPKNGPDGG